MFIWRKIILDNVEKLSVMLKKFDIPFYRLTINKNNLTWLSKNLKKKNSTKPNFSEVQQLVNYCLSNHLYKS